MVKEESGAGRHDYVAQPGKERDGIRDDPRYRDLLRRMKTAD
jgi:hypothetical protein